MLYIGKRVRLIQQNDTMKVIGEGIVVLILSVVIGPIMQ